MGFDIHITTSPDAARSRAGARSGNGRTAVAGPGVAAEPSRVEAT